ncbi:TonB-dependent receptor [Chitinimonas lacunae]|uniref:TonB-dependent receptor n=1 Tax=Chitinimonas lacunae TaxID=1963018 RepID=A0ABV8MQ04_9NEIS
MMKLKRVALAVAAIGYAGLGFSVQAAEVAKAERIDVTGTSIKRVSKEGALPVVTVKREEIERSGAQTVADVLQSLTANAGSFGDQTVAISDSASFSSVSLRGLGPSSTLVLLNGRRVAVASFDSSGGNFVDLNTLPVGAIERVEVLKDGASAIYGSDAIAGVVNIITKRNYKGLEAKAGYRQSDRGDGEEFSTTLSGGLGDLAADGYNLLVSFDFLTREAIRQVDRPWSRFADQRPRNGRDGRSGTGFPISYAKYDPRTPNAPLVFQSAANCPPENVRRSGNSSFCAFDFNPYQDLQPESERYSTFASFNKTLSENARLFIEGSFSNSKTTTRLAPGPLVGDQEFNQDGSFRYLINPDAPTNPFRGSGAYTLVRYRPLEAGGRIMDYDTDTYRLLGGVKGTFSNWDYEVAAGYSASETEQIQNGYYNASKFREALATGRIDPFKTNSPEVINSLLVGPMHSKGKSTSKYIDGKLSGELTELPAGPLGMAVGFEIRRDEIKNVPDINVQAGNVFSTAQDSGANGRQDVDSIFTELNVPLLKQLELQLALRGDRYKYAGRSISNTSPKVALRFQPSSNLLLRASYNEAFHAPSLFQLYKKSESFEFITDPLRCPVTQVDQDCGGFQFKTQVIGNAELEPETAKSYNLGLVFEPVRNVSFGIDYFRIDKKKSIENLTGEVVVDKFPNDPRFVRRLPDEVLPNGTRIPGPIAEVYDKYLNLGVTKTDGFDIDLKFSTDLGSVGKFSFANAMTYVRSHKKSVVDPATKVADPLQEYVDIIDYPRIRNATTFNLDSGSWENTLNINFVDSYSDDEVPSRVTAQTRRVSSFTTVDWQLAYKGIKGARLVFGAKNLFDREPPSIQSGSTASSGYNGNLIDGRGRMLYISGSYTFF